MLIIAGSLWVGWPERDKYVVNANQTSNQDRGRETLRRTGDLRQWVPVLWAILVLGQTSDSPMISTLAWNGFGLVELVEEWCEVGGRVRELTSSR